MTTTRTGRSARTRSIITTTLAVGVAPLLSLALVACSSAPDPQASISARSESVTAAAPQAMARAKEPGGSGERAEKHWSHRGHMPLRQQQGELQQGELQQGELTPQGGIDRFSGGDAARGMDGKLVYFGGRVISNVKVYTIFWTSAVPTEIQTNIGAFVTAVTNSSYWASLSEYSTVGLVGDTDDLAGSNQTIGPGSFGGSIMLTPMNLNTTLNSYDVAQELVTQIGLGVIPAPELDANGNVNSLYVFEFPSNYTVMSFGGTSCIDFCGFHDTTQLATEGGTLSVPYAVIPDTIAGPCAGPGCSTGNKLDSSYMIHSHEIGEAVTDMEVGLGNGFLSRPLAWYDAADLVTGGSNGGEIGDLCNGVAGTAAGYAVQKLWSNANGACIDSPPLCNGTTQPPACTPCTAADNGIGCSGSAPVCETHVNNPHLGQCVACTSGTGCPTGPTAYCDTNDKCRGCIASDCTGATAVCETSGAQQGICVLCDPQHATVCTGATSVCDPASFTCVGCATAATCPKTMSICDVDQRICRACQSAGDCPGGVCDMATTGPTAGQCVGCLVNKDCGSAGVCDTTTNTCTCTTDMECDNPTPTCGPSPTGGGTTGGNKTAGDCSSSKKGPVCSAGLCTGATTGPKDAGTDAGHHTVKPGSDAGAGSKPGSSGGCNVARAARTAPSGTAGGATEVPDLGFLLLPIIGFIAGRARRRECPT